MGIALSLVACGSDSDSASSSLRTPGAPPGIAVAGAVAPLPWENVAYTGGMVSVSHPLAAEAGAEVLRQGGNAIDAAAAIQWALNTVEPYFSGIGGGAFMMVHVASENRTYMINGRERAPAAATPNQFMVSNANSAEARFDYGSTSGLAVGVPGTLQVVDTAVRRWGTRSLASSFQPAIKIAENGFKINQFLAGAIVDSGRTDLQPETAAVYRPGGMPLKQGDLLVQKDLAKTFRTVAEKGVEAFYKGEIAQAIVEAQKRSRTPVAAEGVGRMGMADLASYFVDLRDPIELDYRGWHIVSGAPPGSGGLTIGLMLKMLERFPLGDAGQGYGFGSPRTLHVMTEAMRLGFADRGFWIGDEDYVKVPKRGLLHPDYVASRSALINPDKRMATPAPGNPLPFDGSAVTKAMALTPSAKDPEAGKGGHTTHFSVVDRFGNVVSMTSTIQEYFGTGIMVPGWGFMLNNILTDFNLEPVRNAATGDPGSNDVAPGKRPRSSMSPTIVFKDRKPVLAYGSPGGTTIINTVFNTTLNLIDHGMTIQQAIHAPRWNVTSANGLATCEGGAAFMRPAFGVATQDALRALGHPLLSVNGSAVALSRPGTDACTTEQGSVQGIVIDLQTGHLYGGADRRLEGTVIGITKVAQ